MFKLWRRWSQAYVGLLWDVDGWLTRFWYRRQVKLRGRCEACGECCTRLVLWHREAPVQTLQTFAELVEVDPFTYGRFQPHDINADGDLLFQCSKLDEDGRCTVYLERPVICRRYPDPRMFLRGGSLPENCTYQVVLAQDLR